MGHPGTQQFQIFSEYFNFIFDKFKHVAQVTRFIIQGLFIIKVQICFSDNNTMLDYFRFFLITNQLVDRPTNQLVDRPLPYPCITKNKCLVQKLSAALVILLDMEKTQGGSNISSQILTNQNRNTLNHFLI